MLDINQLKTTAYHPQCDGLTERFNRTLKTMISCYFNENQNDWDELLPFLAFAYNTSTHSTTNFTPGELVMLDVPRHTHPKNFWVLGLGWVNPPRPIPSTQIPNFFGLPTHTHTHLPNFSGYLPIPIPIYPVFSGYPPIPILIYSIFSGYPHIPSSQIPNFFG